MSKYNMRYTILGIQQSKMIEYKLDLADALLIDTLRGMYASPSFERTMDGNEVYIWVNQTFLLDYIPVLGSRATLQRKLNKLEDLGFLKRIVRHTKGKQKGNFSYITFLPKVEELTEYDTINHPRNNAIDKDISNVESDSKPHKIKVSDTLSQDDTRGCIRKTQGLYQDDTRVVSERHNKDTLNKDTLNKDTPSFIQEKERMNLDNSIDKINQRKAEDILTKSNYTSVDELYHSSIEYAVYQFIFSDNLIIKGEKVIKGLLEKRLESLTIEHIDNAISKFEEQSKVQPISNSQKYFMSCLYESLFSTDIDLKKDLVGMGY